MTLDPRLTADAIRYREAIERSFDALAQAILRLSPFLVERERAARQEHEAREMIAAAWPIDPAPVPSLPRVRHPKRVLAETDPMRQIRADLERDAQRREYVAAAESAIQMAAWSIPVDLAARAMKEALQYPGALLFDGLPISGDHRPRHGRHYPRGEGEVDSGHE